MTREDFFYQPYFAPFGYVETEKDRLGDEPGRREILRPNVKPLAPGSGGSGPRDPGTGGGGGGGLGPVTCWDKMTDRCFHTTRASRLVRTGRLVPVGDLKLGIAANPERFLCGSGRDSIGAEDSELLREQYFRHLRDMGFSEVVVEMGHCGLWDPEGIAENYLSDLLAALNAGYQCNEIQLWLPNDICECLENGIMTEDQFELILDEINNLCHGERILGIFIDEPTAGGTEHDRCKHRLSYFNRVCINKNIPLLLSGYYTTAIPATTGAIAFGPLTNDVIEQYATGGVVYSGYRSTNRFWGAELPFAGWHTMLEEFEDKLGDDAIFYAYANPVYNHFNTYLQVAKEMFGRLYLYTGDIFIGNDYNRSRTLDGAIRTCCRNRVINEIGAGNGCPAQSWGGPCGYLDQRLAVDADPSSSGYTGQSADEIYAAWTECTRNHPEFYGQPICENIRAYERCVRRGFWPTCTSAELAAGQAIDQYIQPRCVQTSQDYITCETEQRRIFCDEYWTALEMFVQAALKEGWLQEEYVEEYTGTIVTYCNKRNCDDCDPSNPAHWSANRLPECPKPIGRTLGENQGWIDPLIG